LSDFNEIWIFSTDFRKSLNYVVSSKSDGQTDTTKLTVPLRNFAKAPKNTTKSPFHFLPNNAPRCDQTNAVPSIPVTGEMCVCVCTCCCCCYDSSCITAKRILSIDTARTLLRTNGSVEQQPDQKIILKRILKKQNMMVRVHQVQVAPDSAQCWESEVRIHESLHSTGGINYSHVNICFLSLKQINFCWSPWSNSLWNHERIKKIVHFTANFKKEHTQVNTVPVVNWQLSHESMWRSGRTALCIL
jgi:hypothetical protein